MSNEGRYSEVTSKIVVVKQLQSYDAIAGA